jgi:hypothetical protein
MIFNTAYSQFYGAAQDDTQEHLWHHMSKWSSDAWVADSVKPHVFVVTVYNSLLFTGLVNSSV